MKKTMKMLKKSLDLEDSFKENVEIVEELVTRVKIIKPIFKRMEVEMKEIK
jgi:hypothetical protein